MKDLIIIYAGSSGSGKTELAINQSMKYLQKEKQVFIVDLDVVNPYFRSREKREELKKIGIQVIAPPGKFAMADLPLISPEIKGLMQKSNRVLIVDVGGDEIGAKSLSSFYPVLKDIDHQMSMVVNPYRPFTRNSQQIRTMIQEIELSSRLKISNIISNPNLGSETNLSIIKNGHGIVKKVSEEIHLPISYLAIEESVYQKMGDFHFDEPIFIIKRYMKLPWDAGQEVK
ncbi:MAG: hypothetical protein JXC36_08285 [Candidatus Atribacteria bacterium]|nr:hypothetical protein [Candidatus Atribacteria bacterium]